MLVQDFNPNTQKAAQGEPVSTPFPRKKAGCSWFKANLSIMVLETLSQKKKTHHKKGLVEWLKV
jgi:hypothetical protein